MTPNKPGRPPIDRSSPTIDVTLRLPTNLYDKSYRAARRERLTVAEWFRAAIRRAMPTDRGRDEI